MSFWVPGCSVPPPLDGIGSRDLCEAGVPWRGVARAEGDPVIILEAIDSQNRQSERFSQATKDALVSSLRLNVNKPIIVSASRRQLELLLENPEIERAYTIRYTVLCASTEGEQQIRGVCVQQAVLICKMSPDYFGAPCVYLLCVAVRRIRPAE